MCTGSLGNALLLGVGAKSAKPGTQAVATPALPQASQQPDSLSEQRRRQQNAQRSTMAGGTWLTGVSGVPTQTINTGSTTLLGG
jgi:hypothetical protein